MKGDRSEDSDKIVVSVVDKGYFVGHCGFDSRHFYPEDNECGALFVFCLTRHIQDAVVAGYFVSTQGRNSVVALCGKVIRFDSGADTPRLKKPAALLLL